MASVQEVTFFSAQALTATANSDAASLEYGSDKFIGTLVATAVNGATTVATKIQHSPDGSNWFDLASFANLVGVNGSEVVQITASVLPRVRGVVTLTGGTQAATVTLKLWHDKRRN